MEIIARLVFLIVLCQTPYSYGFVLGTNTSQGTCEDATSNCDLFDICQRELNTAKELCRKYCNLCDVVDGVWSLWGSWGQCDATCGNGTRSRVRTCDNPAPEHGGDDCRGDKDQISTCVANPCPVHGGWSGWSLWGSCSSTCGFGIQRRDRACDNPWPSKDGNHCFGDSVDINTCTNIQCPVGWSQWSNWGTCSVSCGVGMQLRTRVCQNPIASLINSSCDGLPHETTVCVKNSCSGTPAFTASHAENGPVANTIRLTDVHLNEGNDYNLSTGVFTCSVPGLYFFSATIHKAIEISTDAAFCFIQKNEQNQILLDINPVGHDPELGRFSATGSGSFRLNINDTMRLGGCSSIDTFTVESCYFTGILVKSDN